MQKVHFLTAIGLVLAACAEERRARGDDDDDDTGSGGANSVVVPFGGSPSGDGGSGGLDTNFATSGTGSASTQDPCGSAIEVQLEGGSGHLFGDATATVGAGTSALAGKCGGNGTSEVVFQFTTPSDFYGLLTSVFNDDKTEYTAFVYEASCGASSAELGCQTCAPASGCYAAQFAINTIPYKPNTTYYVAVDAEPGSPVSLSVEVLY